MSYIQVNPIVDKSIRGLCCRPYPNHPKGCPNWGHKQGCPPACPIITDVIDFQQPIFAIYTAFDFGSHVAKMKARHPTWSQRQLECCLYWQPRARIDLQGEVKLFLKDHPEYYVVACPEAQCVNLTATMAAVGINLEWPPVTKAYKIVIAGIPNAKYKLETLEGRSNRAY